MLINIATGPWLPMPAIQGGAVNRLWQGVAEQFAAHGHQVTILCRSYTGQPPNEIINGVTYIRRGGFPQSVNIYQDLLKDLIYALATFYTIPPGDILIINDFWLPVFAALRPQAGKIVINAARFPKGQYWLYANTDLFVAVSQAIAQAISQEYPPAIPRLRVISNPINTHIFFPPKIPRSTTGEKTILYVGRIHPEKGLDLLLNAFSLLHKKISNVKLRIIGPYAENQGGGGQSYLNNLKKLAQNLPVDFCEPIFAPNRLADAYREADLFCYPSLAEKGESFGVAPLEAMATGLVPIVSNLDCFRDFIENDQTGYFFDHRSSQRELNLANTLELALINETKTAQIGLNAAAQALNFSQENIADQYLKVFEELMKKT